MHRHARFALITTALVAAVSAMPAAYVLNGPKWATRTVNYYVNPANADVTEAAADAAIQAGAATWGSQSAADFRFYYMGRTSGTTLAGNGKNEIFFRDTSLGGIIAETYWWADSSGRLVDADIVFYDGGFQFFGGSSGCVGGIYIANTAAHEFGHALGLGHSADPEATMYYMASYCSSTGVTLNNDDLSAVEALYPPTGTVVNTAPSVSISSPSAGASIVLGSTVTLTGGASDQQDGNLSAAIVWSSSLAGQLGVGSAVNATLPLGTQTITASVTDSAGSATSKQVNVTVAPAAVVTSPVALSVSLSRPKSGPRANLTWTPGTAPNVDVYRNGAKVTTTANDGSYADNLGKRALPGVYVYAVCNAGTTNCTASVSVNY